VCHYVPIPCDDNSKCTTEECCAQTGLCVYTPVNCDDDNACTTDSCSPDHGCLYYGFLSIFSLLDWSL